MYTAWPKKPTLCKLRVLHIKHKDWAMTGTLIEDLWDVMGKTLHSDPIQDLG